MKAEAEKAGLVICLQYWVEDEPQAMELARLLADLEAKKRSDVILAFARDSECPVTPLLEETARYCSAKFGIMVFASPFKGEGHPAGPNAIWSGAFATLAKERREGRLRVDSVLFCEPDSAPLSVDWINRVKAAHARGLILGKRITGSVMHEHFFPHVNGNFVAHLSLWDDRPSLHYTPDWRPWDLFHAQVLRSEAHPTNIIRNEYLSHGWTASALQSLAQETAWLHGLRDRSAFEYAQRLCKKGPEMTDLFLRTYPGDFKWLPFLLRSMVMHVRGFRKLIVVTPGDRKPAILRPGSPVQQQLIDNGVITEVELHSCPSYSDDYVGQCVTKMRAWEYSDADEICYLDSDLVFRHAFTPESLRPDGQFVVECRTWDSSGPECIKAWRDVTGELLGRVAPWETMARHPFQYPTKMIHRCYHAVGGEERFVRLGRHFSEFNLLGNWALLHEAAIPHDVNLGCSTVEVRKEDFVRQFWSWGGITPEVEEELRELGVWGDRP